MLGIDPMTAAQGMFGGFGMNMNNMSNGMNVGFGSGQQQMYGNWDNPQNNMYNPTAFANGMGQDYRASGYAGNGGYSQMQQYPNQNYNPQGGYYGNTGYMRGMGRGRGRGYYRGRGGYYGHVHANNQYSGDYQQQGYQNNVSLETMDQPVSAAPSAEDVKKFNDDLAPGGEEEEQDKDETAEKALSKVDRTGDPEDGNPQESADKDGDSTVLQGIPTIDSLDSASSNHDGYPNGPMMGHMDQGYGRGRGYGRGGFYNNRGGYYQNAAHQGPQPAMGQGVVGAPVAPRAMRQGLPNTSTRRLYPGHAHNPSTGEAPENTSRR